MGKRELCEKSSRSCWLSGSFWVFLSGLTELLDSCRWKRVGGVRKEYSASPEATRSPLHEIVVNACVSNSPILACLMHFLTLPLFVFPPVLLFSLTCTLIHFSPTDVSKVLSEGMEISAMILTQDKEKGRFSLSTKTLEAEPGDMLRDPAGVKANAAATVARYHERLQAEQQARDQVCVCV